MPQLTLVRSRGQGVTGRGPRASWDCKWMDVKGEAADRRQNLHSWIPVSDNGGPHHWSWSQPLRTLNLKIGWYSVAPIGVVWLFCQTEVLLHPSSPADVCWSLLLLCFLWMVLGGCVHALRCRLQPGQNQGEEPLRVQREDVMERNMQYSWASQSRGPGPHLPVAVALADSLLLCVLQEPLPDPSVPHIQALLFRLESVSHTLERAEIGSGGTLDNVDQDSKLMDKVRVICTYLQKRMRSLRTLIQVQGEFEASVKDMLEGLGDLWAQLEKLHTGVTLTKEGGQGHGDLALARADAQNLFSVLGHYRNRLQCCQTHLKGSTQLLQELTWTHTHISNSMSGAVESVWPELLLQSNIEQFDKVQESFLSLEQQTSTFQAHLEGLSRGDQEGRRRPQTSASGAESCAVPQQTSPRLHNGHASTSSSSPGPDAHTETDAALSLCQRSAMQFTSTFGRLRKSGKRK